MWRAARIGTSIRAEGTAMGPASQVCCSEGGPEPLSQNTSWWLELVQLDKALGFFWELGWWGWFWNRWGLWLVRGTSWRWRWEYLPALSTCPEGTPRDVVWACCLSEWMYDHSQSPNTVVISSIIPQADSYLLQEQGLDSHGNAFKFIWPYQWFCVFCPIYFKSQSISSMCCYVLDSQFAAHQLPGSRWLLFISAGD